MFWGEGGGYTILRYGTSSYDFDTSLLRGCRSIASQQCAMVRSQTGELPGARLSAEHQVRPGCPSGVLSRGAHGNHQRQQVLFTRVAKPRARRRRPILKPGYPLSWRHRSQRFCQPAIEGLRLSCDAGRATSAVSRGGGSRQTFEVQPHHQTFPESSATLP